MLGARSVVLMVAGALAALVLLGAGCAAQEPDDAATAEDAAADAGGEDDPEGDQDAEDDDAEDAEPALSVMATIAPLADLVEQVAGDRAEVTSLVPSGADSHTYEPTPEDAMRLEDADLYVGNGLSLNDGALATAEATLDADAAMVLLGEEALTDEDLADAPAHLHDHDLAGDHEHEHQTDPDVQVGEVVLVDRDADGEQLAYAHHGHWHGSLPELAVGEDLALGASVVDGTGEGLPLGDDEGELALGLAAADGDAAGLVEVSEHGDHVTLTGRDAGDTEVTVQVRQGDEVVHETPPIGVSVVEDPDREDADDAQGPASAANPHSWMTPTLAIPKVEHLAEVLAEVDPEGAEGYEERAEDYVAELEALDAAIHEAAETVPEEDRVIMTFHDAYGYFARDYGFEMVGALQPSDFSEPSAGDVAALIEQVEQEGTPAVFGSAVYPDDVLEMIAQETGATYHGGLADDLLPDEDEDGFAHSYVGLIELNAATIVEGLGGDPTPITER